MSTRIRLLATCSFLMLCLIFGGSSQIVWQRYLLELLAIPLLAWAAVECPRLSGLAGGTRSLAGLAVAFLIVVIVQLAPLPPQLWTQLPGREVSHAAFGLLGQPMPWLPLSWDPYDTLDAAYAFVPPLALATAIIAFRPNANWLAAVIVLGALVSVLLGAAQASAGETASWLRLYDVRSPGAVGVFSNGNHLGALLIAAIPFAVALTMAGLGPSGTSPQRRMTAAVVGGAVILVIAAGVVLNSSLAAVSLFVPILALSALLGPIGRQVRSMLLIVSVVAAIFGLGVIVLFATSGQFGGVIRGDSFGSRADIWAVTARIIHSSFPAGTGLGTFARAYATHEDPESVDRTFVNHAHNDYLELVSETGLAGLGLLLAFGLWWAIRLGRVWSQASSPPAAKAATIASAAILVSTMVDYPLRTAAVAGVLAVCLAILANAAPDRQRGRRHVRIA